MKKIKDERLILQNLKNIRIAYIVQTVGIVVFLGYDLITKGVDHLFEDPLWFVFLLTIVLSLYLSIGIKIDHEATTKPPKKSLSISIIMLIIISAAIGMLVTLSEGSNLLNGVTMGGILFVCGLVPVMYIYYLRKKQTTDNDN